MEKNKPNNPNPAGNILDQVSRRDGLTVPMGFFDDFARKMEDSLEHRPAIEEPRIVARRSFWQTVRPYVYMAAMFAGVWCMLKMFMLMATPGHDLSIDANPVLANAVSNETFVEDYVIDDISQFDIYNSMVEDSVDFYNIQDSIYNSNPQPDFNPSEQL